MRFYLFSLLLLLPELLFAQGTVTRSRKSYTDTTLSQTAASYWFLLDSGRIASFVRFDSTGYFNSTVAPGWARIIVRGDSGIYYQDFNSRVRLDSNFGGVFNKKQTWKEVDGSPIVTNVDSVEVDSAQGIVLANPSNQRVRLSLVQNLGTSGSPTFTGINSTTLVLSGSASFLGFVDALLATDDAGDVQTIANVKKGRLLYSQDVGTGPIWEDYPFLYSSASNLGFGLTDTSVNKNISTVAQSSDSSAIVSSFTNLGKPEFKMKGSDGVTNFQIDSSGNVGIDGTLHVGSSGITGYDFRVDGTTGSLIHQFKFQEFALPKNLSNLSIYPPSDSGRTAISWWYRHVDSAGGSAIYRALSWQAHSTENSDDTAHNHVSLYILAGTDTTNHAIDWYFGSQWDNQMKVRSSVNIKDSVIIGTGSGYNDLFPRKQLTLLNVANTDDYSFSAEDGDSLKVFNDAGSLIASFDSVGRFISASEGVFSGASVRTGVSGTAKITIDGTDGAGTAGQNSFYEIANLYGTSRNSFQLIIDNDANATTNSFIVARDSQAGAQVFKVSEDGSVTLSSGARGSDAFTTTATTDTVTVSGGASTDYYFIQLTGAGAPSANDMHKVEAITGGFVVHRSASGTSGLTYNWFRIK